jgi:hypothetical protein
VEHVHHLAKVAGPDQPGGEQLRTGKTEPRQVLGQGGPGVRGEPDVPGSVPVDENAEAPAAKVVGRTLVAQELGAVERRRGGVRSDQSVMGR